MYENRGFGGGGNRGGGFGGGNRFGNDRAMTPPVREGEELDVTIEAVGEKGDGVAKVKGFVLFVPSTKANDRVKVRVTRVLSKVGFAQVIGEATPGSKPQGEEKAAEPEFEANEEMDSEDFGDSSDADSTEDDATEEEE